MIEGNDVTIVATGHLVWEALEASKKLNSLGISAEVINIHTIKPLDEDAILKSVSKTGCLVSAEEHNYYGGLGESISRVLALNNPVPQEFVATNDTFGESGTPSQLMKKYGELKRFQSLINYNPLEYKVLKPEEKKLSDKNNPPKLIVEFFEKQKNIKDISCYSNDGGSWKKPDLKFNSSTMIINFSEPFIPRRGRINCSLNEDGKWRWFGTQFTIRPD